LQGRLLIRVGLRAPEIDGFKRILTEPQASLTEQYSALMDTDGVKPTFSADRVRRIAEISWKVKESTKNIGSRRLHTVMERLLELISYEAPDRSGESFEIDAAYVDSHLDELTGNEDLSRYIL
jgi:ATP-dependent HslUV protease ATP-binding subunit HslU